MTTATDAFMRDIKPFFVADALADFSREEHLMSLKYVAGRSGRVVMTEELLPPPASKRRCERWCCRCSMNPTSLWMTKI